MKKAVLYLAWIQSLIATLGSLYLSEIMHIPPCNLCWYQRIFMYPIVFILTVGIISKDKKLYKYVLPLSIIGLTIATYHVLLQQGIIPSGAAPCVAGVSCVKKYIQLLGFITIPMLSLTAFLVITACMLLFKRKSLK